MKFREEKDTLGFVKVPIDRLWGAQTQRSKNNFTVGHEKMPIEVIYALATIKKSAAMANHRLGILSQEKRDLIVQASDEIMEGELDDHFPLVVWQTGSGTQTNMNVNEVIANVANMKSGGQLGQYLPIHPNDDVNKSQSSNDVFPTAVSIALFLQIEQMLLPAVQRCIDILEEKISHFNVIVKCGRTHLMDAVPLTLGQEFSVFHASLKRDFTSFRIVVQEIKKLPIGGSAVGTGLNVPKQFDEIVVQFISEYIGSEFAVTANKFEALATANCTLQLSSVLRGMAISLNKMAQDIRLMASGPRCGLGEIDLPENEPGSSIMPGKINPTQCEMLIQVCLQVMGYDHAVSAASSSQSILQLYLARPLIVYNLMQSITLLGHGIKSFCEKCLIGITPNTRNIHKHLENSLMLVTALNPHIGYDNSAKIARYALENNTTLRKAALELNLVTSQDFDQWVDPQKMTENM